MDEIIFISIASYRDLDLLNTVKNCYKNAHNSKRLFFSIFSQAEDQEHPNLSFIPENQIAYLKTHWSNSRGACWARSIANSKINGKYFLQVDSHSRFEKDWDTILINNYNSASSFWGNKIILSTYPDPFEISNGEDVLLPYNSLKKILPFWDESAQMIMGKTPWADVQDIVNGDEVFHLAAGFIFSTTSVISEIPYDENIYFYGEEASLAIRAYTRGIRIVSPVVKVVYSHYNHSQVNRRLHWEDFDDWHKINLNAQSRLRSFLSGDTSLGIFGIGSTELFKQYQTITGINLAEKII